ncbi:hypothetical protein [Kitasatospora purpeofusca]|uniref:hypothetical protein n=1 Tax=Kitasatospora purpeofusca TaxID=67352 RepID=UPI003830A874
MLNLHVVGITPPQRGTTTYDIPTDHNQLAPRIRQALDAALDAQHHRDTTWRKNSSTKTDKANADDALTNAWATLMDTAGGTATTTAAHHRDAYGIAVAKFERARATMLEALQDAAIHANLHHIATTNPQLIGVDKTSRAPHFQLALALAAEVEQLRLRALDE